MYAVHKPWKQQTCSTFFLFLKKKNCLRKKEIDLKYIEIISRDGR